MPIEGEIELRANLAGRALGDVKKLGKFPVAFSLIAFSDI
ncbi:MAG: hypothetical protein QOE77_3621 [Blastocatellia bacterium]|jgi:hypothetical protein|nr:hypothetical protein [Blastocatellia bacterium]